MGYPQLVPSSRTFGSGNFPVKVYRAQDGAEVRLLYGDKRVGMTMQLTYQNIPDTEADKFVNHYHEMKGTYTRFTLDTSGNAGAKKGYKGIDGSQKSISAGSWGSAWRYAEPPQIQSIYPGVSTVSVNLIAAAGTDTP